MHRSAVAFVLALAASALTATPAEAADIATILGTPGDATWTAACGAGATLPTTTSHGLVDCAPLGAFWEPACLHRVDIDTSPGADPLATCADGTPSSFYIRPGFGADVDRWVIHLQGGGGCNDPVSCQERWCGQQGIYTASQMSSDWDADGIVDRPDHAWIAGISQLLLANDFYGWNHVFVPYCSSDLWQGRASDVDFGGTGAFTVDARGHKILQVVRRMLRKLGLNPGWTAQGGYTVPDLDDATEIIFSGTSAGGFGALHNADWFLEPLSARSGLVVDAAVDVSFDTASDWDVWATNTGLPYNSHRFAAWEDAWDVGGYYDEINAFVDEDCRDWYEPIGKLNRCVSPALVLRLAIGGDPLIDTPTLLRMDLQDNVLSDWLTTSPNPEGDTIVIGGAGGVTATLDDYAAMMRQTMVELAAETETNISVHAPKCGVHVGLERFDAFHQWTTPDSTDVAIPVSLGNDATAHDAILEWFDPGGAFQPLRRIDTDEPGTTLSSCP